MSNQDEQEVEPEGVVEEELGEEVGEETLPEEQPAEEPPEKDEAELLFESIATEESDELHDVPTVRHAAMKTKYKKRIAELEEKLAQAESSKASTSATQLKRPNPDDFQSDEEYSQALDKYDDARAAIRQQEQRQKEESARQLREIRQAVEDYHNNAAEFTAKIENGAARFEAADQAVRAAVEEVIPSGGDVVTDIYISRLGAEAHKVLMKIGLSPKLRQEFQQLLKEDPSGVKAGIFLGEQKQSIKNLKIQPGQSRAAKPALHASGDGGGKTLKSQYAAAMKADNLQKASDLRDKARDQGINPDSW